MKASGNEKGGSGSNIPQEDVHSTSASVELGVDTNGEKEVLSAWMQVLGAFALNLNTWQVSLNTECQRHSVVRKSKANRNPQNQGHDKRIWRLPDLLSTTTFERGDVVRHRLDRVHAGLPAVPGVHGRRPPFRRWPSAISALGRFGVSRRWHVPRQHHPPVLAGLPYPGPQ